MCKLCDESPNGEMVSCQNCGKLICFDVKNPDDIVSTAFVTSEGDLFCISCGERFEENLL